MGYGPASLFAKLVTVLIRWCRFCCLSCQVGQVWQARVHENGTNHHEYIRAYHISPGDNTQVKIKSATKSHVSSHVKIQYKSYVKEKPGELITHCGNKMICNQALDQVKVSSVSEARLSPECLICFWDSWLSWEDWTSYTKEIPPNAARAHIKYVFKVTSAPVCDRIRRATNR